MNGKESCASETKLPMLLVQQPPNLEITPDLHDAVAIINIIMLVYQGKLRNTNMRKEVEFSYQPTSVIR